MFSLASHVGFAAVLLVILASNLDVVAEDPIEAQRRALGGGSISNDGGAVIVAPPTPKPQIKTVYFTAVSPSRQWKAADGRMMIGRLMAFSAPKLGESGPVEVIREGKVRFLRSGSKSPVDFPLEKLSEEDQRYVKGIAQAAKNGPPKASAPEKKEMATTPAGS
ncbi:MAG: hypothetical protein AAGH89_10980 [Verrucomicrobiota bacterium]